MAGERWAVVPGYPDYDISDHGRVRSSLKSRVPILMETYRGEDRYPWAYLVSRSGKGKRIEVHRLVALAFLPLPEEGQTMVCHNDGSRTNNHHTNLRWGTASDNSKDRVRHEALRQGYSGEGCRCQQSSCVSNSVENATRDAKIASLLKDYDTGWYSQQDLVAKYRIHRSSVSRHVRAHLSK